MDTICLILPTAEHEPAVLDYVSEHRAAGETHIGGSADLHAYGSYGDWLARCQGAHAGLVLDPEWGVPYTVWLGIRPEDGRLVGMVCVRRGDSPKVIDFDGHIGAGVRPSERGRGYGGALLALGLDRCRRAGMTRALVTCDAGNAASEAVLRRHGGMFEDARQEPCGNWVHRYWFELPPGEKS